jgi:hypothetical protein
MSHFTKRPPPPPTTFRDRLLHILCAVMVWAAVLYCALT